MLTMRWRTFVLPERDRFNSDESYFNYMKTIKCEGCGMRLIDGDVYALAPLQSELESDKLVMEARIIHKKCYEIEIQNKRI